MTGGLVELPPKPLEERPEIVDAAMRLLTGDASGEEYVPPLDGPDTAREIAKRYAMSERNAKRYVAQAREAIAHEFEADRPHRARALSVIALSVVREAHRDRNWPGVNGAVRNLCTIYGIDSKVVVNGDGLSALLQAAKADPGARDAEIAELEARDRDGTEPR